MKLYDKRRSEYNDSLKNFLRLFIKEVKSTSNDDFVKAIKTIKEAIKEIIKEAEEVKEIKVFWNEKREKENDVKLSRFF